MRFVLCGHRVWLFQRRSFIVKNHWANAFTVALTGQLALIRALAAFRALIASILILNLYRRVIRSMHRRSTSALIETKGLLPPVTEHTPHAEPLSSSFVGRDITGADGDSIQNLLYALCGAPTGVAFVRSSIT